MKINLSTKHGIAHFPVQKSNSSTVLWINETLANELGTTQLKDKEYFKGRFSYFVKENQFFEEISWNDYDEEIAIAERYGGSGIGPNGGGARCGNINGYQLKGIGRNQLSGNACDHWHSYGGVNLIDAVYETIYSLLLNKVLPVGALNIYGLMLSGENTAMLPGLQDREFNERRGFGALLIRDITVRPAHFLPAPDFITKGKNISPDSVRLAEFCETFYKNFKNKQSFIHFISNCISNYGKQFAFARIARIAHGGLSPSNISIDGRWLDLSNSSFIGGGRNITNNMPFLSEQDFPISLIKEFLHNFSKYTNTHFNCEPLIELYIKTRENYKEKSVCYYFGIDISNIEFISSSEYTILFNKFIEIIDGKRKIETGRVRNLAEDDPILILILNVFYQAFSPTLVGKSHLRCELGSLASEFIYAIYKNFANCQLISKENVTKSMFIIAMKRFLGSEFFFMGRLEAYIFDIVVQRNMKAINGIITAAESLIESCFNLKKDIVYHLNCDPFIDILDVNNTKLSYNIYSDKYSVFHGTEEVTYDSFEAAAQVVLAEFPEGEYFGFGIRRYVESLKNSIKFFEFKNER